MSFNFEDQNEETQPSNPLEALVGEGKKFQTVEDLARGKLEADTYIAKLHEETAKYREMLEESTQSQAKMDKILEELTKRPPTETQTPNGGTPPNTADEGTTGTGPKETSGFSEETVAEMVKKMLGEQTAQTQAKKNMEFVNAKLKDRFKGGAADAIKTRAATLGTTVEELASMAERNPNLFFATMGMDSSSSQNKDLSFTASSVNTEATPTANDGSVRNRSWWNTQRQKQGKSWFYRPENQKQYATDMATLGPRF